MTRHQRIKDQQNYNRLQKEISRLHQVIMTKTGHDLYIRYYYKFTFSQDWLRRDFHFYELMCARYTLSHKSLFSLITRLFSNRGELIPERCFEMVDDEKLNKELPIPIYSIVYYARPDGDKRNSGKRQYILSIVNCTDQIKMHELLKQCFREESLSQGIDNENIVDGMVKKFYDDILCNTTNCQWHELQLAALEGLTQHLIIWEFCHTVNTGVANFEQDIIQEKIYGATVPSNLLPKVIVPPTTRNATIKGTRRNPFIRFANPNGKSKHFLNRTLSE